MIEDHLWQITGAAAYIEHAESFRQKLIGGEPFEEKRFGRMGAALFDPAAEAGVTSVAEKKIFYSAWMVGHNRESGLEFAYAGLPTGPPTVDDKVLTRHVRTGLGTQEENCPSIFALMGHTSEGNELADPVEEFFGLIHLDAAG